MEKQSAVFSSKPHKSASPSVYTPFFSWVFKEARYKAWKDGTGLLSLLRVCGGPGSGKTTFATLALDDLKHQQPEPVVLSAFTSPNPITSTSPSQDLLEIIQAQLSLPRTNPPVHPQGFHSLAQPPHPPITTNALDETALRQAIKTRLAEIPRTYLVVDDLDALWAHPTAYLAVEQTLQWIRELGVRILVTSRGPFRKPLGPPSCDVEEEDEHSEGNEWYVEEVDEYSEGNEWNGDDEPGNKSPDPVGGLRAWWVCMQCEDPKFVCDECKKKGHGCLINSEHGPEHMERRHRDLFLDLGSSDPNLTSLVVHHLQLEHGRFWPSSSDNNNYDYPPLSPLGHRLLSTTTSDASAGARQLVNKIVLASQGNVAIALLRVQAILGAETLGAALALLKQDRIPPPIVAAFDAVVARVQARAAAKEPMQRRLGAMAVHAIRSLQGADATWGITFDDLQKLLREEEEDQSGERHGFDELLGDEDVLDKLVGASAGLLMAQESPEQDGMSVVYYHHTFRVYVAERYNPYLSVY